MFKFYRNDDGNHVLATEAEISIINETKVKLDALRQRSAVLRADVKAAEDACTHDFFYDTAGMIYDVRRCAICGGFIRQI